MIQISAERVRRRFFRVGLLAAGFCVALSTGVQVKAQELDPASQEALEKTQQLLRSRSERNAYIETNPSAKASDDRVHSLLGSRSDRAYELSAQITETLVRQTGGDAKQLEALVQQLASDPQLMKQYLTPAQAKEIRSMASEIERSSDPKPGR